MGKTKKNNSSAQFPKGKNNNKFKQDKRRLDADVGKINKSKRKLQKSRKFHNQTDNFKQDNERTSIHLPRKLQQMSLREKMLQRLKAAKFRMINEQLYTSKNNEVSNVFKNNEELYNEYHEGFRLQVSRWPINPVDIIIRGLLKKAQSDKIKIADFGCGEAKIAESLEGQAEVFSFDLVALNDRVIQCDMAHTSLQDDSVDVAVFCLSLMCTDIAPYIKEANRVLKTGGTLKIAEVESRFEDVNLFIKSIQCLGFSLNSSDFSHNMFYFINFKKISNVTKKKEKRISDLTLKPCMYKKR